MELCSFTTTPWTSLYNRKRIAPTAAVRGLRLRGFNHNEDAGRLSLSAYSLTEDTSLPIAPTLVGKAGEALVAAELLRRGVDIATPAYDRGVDLLAYRANKRRGARVVVDDTLDSITCALVIGVCPPCNNQNVEQQGAVRGDRNIFRAPVGKQFGLRRIRRAVAQNEDGGLRIAGGRKSSVRSRKLANVRRL